MNRTLLSVSYAMLALYGASAATPNTGYVDDDSYGATLDLSEKLQQAYFSDAVAHPVWFGVSPQTAKAAFIAHGGSEGPLTVEVSSPYGSSAWKNAEVKTWSAFVSQNPAVGLWQVDLCAQKRYFRIDLAGVPGLLWLSKTKTVLMR